jgi:hypothetical protein
LIHSLAGGIAGVEYVVRVLNVVFWVAAALLVVSLTLSYLSYDFMAGLLSDKGLRVVNAVLMGAVVVCSGAITAYEFWLNPLEDTERGEWTGRTLFYAIVFAITLFMAFYFVPIAFF